MEEEDKKKVRERNGEGGGVGVEEGIGWWKEEVDGNEARGKGGRGTKA